LRHNQQKKDRRKSRDDHASFGDNDLYQYDKAGNLLQVVGVPGLSNEIVGAEPARVLVIADNFESGDTSAWSLNVP